LSSARGNDIQKHYELMGVHEFLLMP